ncbi:MAG: YeeE/YedE family protein [Myxococcales bacterium]|nr:YeeE/YedE family protein [Myxococcales bacterium]
MSLAQRRGLVALAAGLLFGLGLALAGMTDPRKVLGFLSFGAGWDPSLAFVMAGAIGVNAAVARVALKRSKPRFDSQFHLSPLRAVTPRLVLGAALFGVGWGLAGYCPGPALASLATGHPAVLGFVAAMLSGWHLTRALEAFAVDATPAEVVAPSASKP